MKKLTDEKWINLFKRDDGYILASRNETPDPDKIGVVAAIVIFENKLVLLKQVRNIIGRSEIDLPAGLVDEGETPLQAVMREVKEETGLDTEVIIGADHGMPNDDVYFSSAGLTDENYKLFRLRAVKGAQIKPEEGIEVILFDTHTKLPSNIPVTMRANYAAALYALGYVTRKALENGKTVDELLT